jgi:hypothetical protein
VIRDTPGILVPGSPLDFDDSSIAHQLHTGIAVAQGGADDRSDSAGHEMVPSWFIDIR